MATITKQKIKETGIDPTYSAATATGDKFKNIGRQIIHIKNGSAAAVTVTIPVQKSDASSAEWGKVTKPDVTKSIPAGGEALIGLLPKHPFNDSSGMAIIEYSAATSVTVAVFDV
jgi:hypothetical protein